MKRRKGCLWVIFLLEWIALIAQSVVHMQASPADRIEAVIRLFSFFTILTNLLVGVCFTSLLFPPRNGQVGPFQKPSMQTAVTMYITVVGLVYSIALRGLWHSGPLQTVLHETLHTVIPLLVIVYWFFWVDAKTLRYKNVLPWLIYPAAYCVFVLFLGSLSHWYPYPFLNPITLSASRVFRNCMTLTGVFVLFSLIYVYWGRKKRPPSANQSFPSSR